jgi:integrase
MPDVEKFRGSPLTLDEARRLLSVTAGDRLSPLWWVAIDTGLRIGELLALGWNHVDLEAGTLRVEGQLQRRDGRWERTRPKAARSLDVVSLSAGNGRRAPSSPSRAGERAAAQHAVFRLGVPYVPRSARRCRA